MRVKCLVRAVFGPQATITGSDGEAEDVRNAHGGDDVHRAGARQGGAPRRHRCSGERIL